MRPNTSVDAVDSEKKVKIKVQKIYNRTLIHIEMTFKQSGDSIGLTCP